MSQQPAFQSQHTPVGGSESPRHDCSPGDPRSVLILEVRFNFQ